MIFSVTMKFFSGNLLAFPASEAFLGRELETEVVIASALEHFFGDFHSLCVGFVISRSFLSHVRHNRERPISRFGFESFNLFPDFHIGLEIYRGKTKYLIGIIFNPVLAVFKY